MQNPLRGTDSPSAGAARSEPERRGSARRPCRLTGACRPVRFPEGESGWPTETLDLSEAGVGLLVCRRFEPGTLLGLTLEGPSGESACLPLLQVRSVRAIEQHWRLGCQWAGGLDASDLADLLGPRSQRRGA